MKSAILANAALCLCPPLVATSVTLAVPPARHAVHKLTASKPKHHKVAHKAAKPKEPCVTFVRKPASLAFSDAPAGHEPLISGLEPITFAQAPNVPPRPTSLVTGPGPLPWLPFDPGTRVNPVRPRPVGDVPEPATWLMMLTGFMAVGVIVRRHRTGARKQTISAGGAAAAELGASAALLMAPSPATHGAVGHTLRAVIAKKAALCVCSGAILATAVTTVPPIKRAVHAATGPTLNLTPADCLPD
jgi:hypothetical protein